MSTGLTGRTGVVIDLKNVNDLTTKLADILDELGVDTSIKWSWGDGVKACNVLYHEKFTIAGGGQNTLDINAGTVKVGEAAATPVLDAFGDALTLKAIKFLYIKNTSPALKVSIFGSADLDLLIMSSTADKLVLETEGFFLWACPTAAGVDTTDNTNLELTVSGSEGEAIIEVVILGVKATE